METGREDVGIAIRSAFLRKGVQQRFSLIALLALSIILLIFDTLEKKPLKYLRSFFQDTIYRGSIVVSIPSKGFKSLASSVGYHMDIFNKNIELKKENERLKGQIYDPDFLIFENNQLRKLLNEQVESSSNLVSSRVILDKDSPYLNSFIINSGSNRDIKKGMAVLDGKNFIGRIVDVNFFSSRILLITDLNSKIPVIIEPKGYHAILSGTGKEKPTLDFLPENHKIETGNKIYTSGKEGIFSPGIPIGEVKRNEETVSVQLFSDLSQVTFVNINLGDLNNNK